MEKKKIVVIILITVIINISIFFTIMTVLMITGVVSKNKVTANFTNINGSCETIKNIGICSDSYFKVTPRTGEESDFISFIEPILIDYNSLSAAFKTNDFTNETVFTECYKAMLFRGYFLTANKMFYFPKNLLDKYAKQYFNKDSALMISNFTFDSSTNEYASGLEYSIWPENVTYEFSIDSLVVSGNTYTAEVTHNTITNIDSSTKLTKTKKLVITVVDENDEMYLKSITEK